PANSWTAIHAVNSATARYTCETLGVENEQGNREVVANWRIDGATRPVLASVPSGIYRPAGSPQMQQVRAKVVKTEVVRLEYLFERERKVWDPEFSPDEVVGQLPERDLLASLKVPNIGASPAGTWKLVKGLAPRTGAAMERDQAALRLAAPESGSFILV